LPTGLDFSGSGTGSNTHVVHSGKDENGDPYYVEQHNVVIGDTLYRTERVYNPMSKQLDERHYTLDLTDPDAEPVLTRRSRS
jgi:hypothetical protein